MTKNAQNTKNKQIPSKASTIANVVKQSRIKKMNERPKPGRNRRKRQQRMPRKPKNKSNNNDNKRYSLLLEGNNDLNGVSEKRNKHYRIKKIIHSEKITKAN